MKTVKCYRCGKEMEIDTRHPKKMISCPHCHANMAIDLPTQKKLKYTRYAFVILIVAVIMLAFNKSQQVNSYVAMLVTIVIASGIAYFADTLCFIFCAKVFGLNYAEYHTEKERNKKAKSSKEGKK